MSGEGSKTGRQGKGNPKKRFSGWLEVQNYIYLESHATAEDRSIASFLNRLIRRAREEERTRQLTVGQR